MTTALLLLLSKFWPYIVGLLGALASLKYIQVKAKASGKEEILEEIKKEEVNAKDKWSKIDNDQRSFDDALNRLSDKH